MQDGSHLSEQEIKVAALEEMRFHFVFNSLNSIRYMIHRDQELAYSMVQDLGIFMRGQLDTILSHDMIHLPQELKCARAYAMLEKVQSCHMEVDWRCSCTEGYVRPGAVCSAVEAVIKRYIRGASGKKTLVVEEISGWCRAVRIRVAEEGEESEVLVGVADSMESLEAPESRDMP